MLARIQHVLTALLLLLPTGLAGHTSHYSPFLDAALQQRADSRPCAPCDEPSVYVCQNYDWQPPCILIRLGQGLNGQMSYWKAPEPGGPGPFGTTNHTVGSWGPSPGVTTVWEDHEGNHSDDLGYPGTGRVDAYWGQDIWTWYPAW